MSDNGDNGEFRFPHLVAGWLTEAEGRKLAALAKGLRVLEIGSFEGRSTVCLAQTAAAVDCIDPCDGRATPWLRDTEEVFLANLRRFGVRDKCRLFVGTTAEVAPSWEAGEYDLIFVDGDHSQAALRVDIREALRLLKPGGLVAFHDYESQKDPAVTVAVHQLIAGGAELVDVVDSLAVVRPGGKKREGKPVVVLAMPRRGGKVHFTAADGFWNCSFGGCEVIRTWTLSSILDHAFNRLWATCLNLRKQGATHGAFLHDDVLPPHGWLDMMLTEQSRVQADILSAVVAIKGPHGLTSTAVETDDVWRPRRLTTKEVHELPVTFGDEEVGGEILLNTGLCVIDLRKPWVDTPEPLVFQTLSRIIPDEEGELLAQTRSEDWEFSRAARARGARLFATRAVTPSHGGEYDYPSDQVWGAWQTDELFAERQEPEGAKAGEPCTATYTSP